jgi:rod shape-determining protein MreC
VRHRSLLWVLGLLVVLVALTNLRLPIANRIKNTVSNGFVPFIDFSTRLQSSGQFLLDRFKAYGDLQVENTELKRQLGELAVRVARVSELERENREYSAMLDFKNKSDLKLVPARVIARDPSNWWQTVHVDRGSKDGIAKDMPVLTLEGLVGKTIDVSDHNSLVLLLTDENCRVPGHLRESAVYGIVQGTMLTGGSASQCKMTFLNRTAEIKPNDKVYTSGLASGSNLEAVFPQGILIGTVKSSQDSKKNLLYQEVTVTPAVDLSHIDEVFIGVGVKASAFGRPASISPSKVEEKATEAPPKSRKN